MKMKDAQGNERGQCEVGHCTCTEYFKPEKGHKCDFCDHLPTDHKLKSSVVKVFYLYIPNKSLGYCCLLINTPERYKNM